MIRELWSKLDKQQRRLVTGGAIFIFIVLILEFGIFPLREAQVKIRQAAQINQKKLNEMVVLDKEFIRQEVKTTRVKKALAARTADFSLFSYLEKKAQQAGVKGNIKNMSSSRGAQTANYEESLIDMRLDKITVKQLTDFLYYAESTADLIKIKRITVTKMRENPEYLSAQIQLALFQALSSHPGGR
jgi:general secretion pathway protein M